jgi:hypothetical protein
MASEAMVARDRRTLMKLFTAVALFATTLTATLAGAGADAQKAHVIAPLNQVQWGPAPPMLPAGAQIAVLAGNPMGTGYYTVRLKFPANYTIPPHWHPTDENVAVVSGDLFVGMGDVIDRNAATPLGIGGFGSLPAGMHHFAFTKQETTVLLFGQGPVEFTYVKPSDDPRHAGSTKGTR